MAVLKPLAIGGIAVGLPPHYVMPSGTKVGFGGVLEIYLEAIDRARREETGHLMRAHALPRHPLRRQYVS